MLVLLLLVLSLLLVLLLLILRLLALLLPLPPLLLLPLPLPLPLPPPPPPLQQQQLLLRACVCVSHVLAFLRARACVWLPVSRECSVSWTDVRSFVFFRRQSCGSPSGCCCPLLACAVWRCRVSFGCSFISRRPQTAPFRTAREGGFRVREKHAARTTEAVPRLHVRVLHRARASGGGAHVGARGCVAFRGGCF